MRRKGQGISDIEATWWSRDRWKGSVCQAGCGSEGWSHGLDSSAKGLTSQSAFVGFEGVVDALQLACFG